MKRLFRFVISDGEPPQDTAKAAFTRSTQPQYPPNCYDKDYVLADLLDVGKTKLMGYLPLRTLREVCESDPMQVRQQLIDQGLSTFYFDLGDCQIGSGALYACDAKRLQDFLDMPQHKAILEKYDWPQTAEGFLLHTVHTLAPVETHPDLYDLIALAFNDKRPFYRQFESQPQGPQPYTFK